MVDTPEGRAFEHAPVSLETRWWVRQQWVSVRDNLRLTDEATAIRELGRFGAVGGGTVADPTTDGIGRDPDALVRISEAAGVHVVMGAGYYVHGSHPAWIEDAPDRAITQAIVDDLVSGVGETRIRAGMIGEIGCSWPMTSREGRVLRAAGRAQRETGAPLMVHPGRDPRAVDEIVSELESVGADLDHTTIAHLERTVRDAGELVALARRGLWLSLDTFGLETAFYPLNPATVMPNDGGRIGLAEAVIEAGLGGASAAGPGHLPEAPAGRVRGPRLRPPAARHRPDARRAGARPIGAWTRSCATTRPGSSPGKAPARSPAAADPYQFWTEPSLRCSCCGL